MLKFSTPLFLFGCYVKDPQPLLLFLWVMLKIVFRFFHINLLFILFKMGKRGRGGKSGGTPNSTPTVESGAKSAAAAKRTRRKNAEGTEGTERTGSRSASPEYFAERSVDEAVDDESDSESESSPLTLADMTQLLAPLNLGLITLTQRMDQVEQTRVSGSSTNPSTVPGMSTQVSTSSSRGHSEFAQSAYYAQRVAESLGAAGLPSQLPNVSDGVYRPVSRVVTTPTNAVLGPLSVNMGVPVSIPVSTSSASMPQAGVHCSTGGVFDQPRQRGYSFPSRPTQFPDTGAWETSGGDFSHFPRASPASGNAFGSPNSVSTNAPVIAQMAHRPKMPMYGSKDVKDKIEPLQYITELQQFQATMRYTDTDMMDHVLPYSLKESAYTWFKAFRSLMGHMVDFAEYFLQEYLGHDFRYRMEYDLQNVNQAKDELTSTFLLGFAQRYRFLHPGCLDTEIINKVVFRINPKIHKLVCHQQFTSISELCIAMQAAQAQLRRYSEYDTSLGSKFEGSNLYSLKARDAGKSEMLPSALDPLKMGSTRKGDSSHFVRDAQIRVKELSRAGTRRPFDKKPFAKPFNKPFVKVGSGEARPQAGSSAIPRLTMPSGTKPTYTKPSVTNQYQRGSTSSKLDIVCYSCGEPGHFSSKCPKRGLVLLVDGKEVSWDSIRLIADDADDEESEVEVQEEEEFQDECDDSENC